MNYEDCVDRGSQIIVDMGVAAKLERKMLIAATALQEIANEDFRGNRPASAAKAYRALKKMEEV